MKMTTIIGRQCNCACGVTADSASIPYTAESEMSPVSSHPKSVNLAWQAVIPDA